MSKTLLDPKSPRVATVRGEPIWQSPAVTDESFLDLEQELQWQESFLMLCAHLANTQLPDDGQA